MYSICTYIQQTWLPLQIQKTTLRVQKNYFCQAKDYFFYSVIATRHLVKRNLPSTVIIKEKTYNYISRVLTVVISTKMITEYTPNITMFSSIPSDIKLVPHNQYTIHWVTSTFSTHQPQVIYIHTSDHQQKNQESEMRLNKHLLSTLIS